MEAARKKAEERLDEIQDELDSTKEEKTVLRTQLDLLQKHRRELKAEKEIIKFTMNEEDLHVLQMFIGL